MSDEPARVVFLTPNSIYRSLPKVELHRHLEGSLRLTTMLEIAHAYGMEVRDLSHLHSLVQITTEDPLTFKNFLSKFETLRRFYRSPEIIGRVTREAIADAAADNVRYLELRFTPAALSAAQGYKLSEVMDWVVEHAHLASQEYGIITKLIVSVNRHESVKIAEQVVQLALERQESGIVGLDLAGNEAQYSASPFAGLFREARQSGLHITLHAGEWGGADHIAQALVDFNAERIGHGVRVLDDPAVVELARQRAAYFEVCMTSNYQSGVVASLASHPVRQMLAAGLNVTLATDDPSISRITLSDEYRLLCEQLRFPIETLRRLILNASQAAFLSESQKADLAASLARQFDEVLPSLLG